MSPSILLYDWETRSLSITDYSHEDLEQKWFKKRRLPTMKAIVGMLKQAFPVISFLPSSNMTPQVTEFKGQGFIPFEEPPEIVNAEPRMKYVHLRYHFEECEDQQNVLGIFNKGGVTVAYQVAHDQVEWAIAYCNLSDNFSRSRGRAICEGRFKVGRHYRTTWPGNPKDFLANVVRPQILKKAKDFYERHGFPEDWQDDYLW